MEDFRFSLDETRPTKLFYCPACNKKRFKRYVDKQTGEYLPLEVGRCNREVQCGYHYKPNEYFKDNAVSLLPHKVGISKPVSHVGPLISKSNKCHPDFIPQDIFERTLLASGYSKNNFLKFIERRFGPDVRTQLAKMYNIGTSNYWPGAAIFWQVDSYNRVRTGKVILYDEHTGKRVKQPFTHVNWAHAILSGKNLIASSFQLAQCLFGEHLINTGPRRGIVIVESEKTAVLCSIYFPDYIWLACGGLSMLNEKLFMPVKQFPLILYPDLKATKKWEVRRNELIKHGFKVAISNFLETSPCVTPQEREAGLDIADFLLRFDPELSPLQKMSRHYPLIKTLVDRLDLIEMPN